MLLSATKAIYSGNLPVKKLYSNNNLVYKPKEFVFATIADVPMCLNITGAGVTGVNGIWPYSSSGYTKTVSLSTYVFNTTTAALSWKTDLYRVLPSPGAIVYSVTGLNPVPNYPPLTGWYSVNPSYNPPPTIAINTPASAVHAALTGTLNWSPALLENSYYINNTSLVGIASSNNLAQIIIISRPQYLTTFLSSVDVDYFTNLTAFRTSITNGNVVFNNHKKINTITIDGTPKQVLIYNNPELRELYYTENQNVNFNNITNNPLLCSITIGTNNGTANHTIASLDLTNIKNLKILDINNPTPNLTSLQILSSYPEFVSFTIGQNNLSGYQVLDTILSGLMVSGRNYEIKNSTGLFGRSNASNKAFLDFYTIKGASTVTSFEIDPLYPLQSIPSSGYYPSTMGNEIVVSCPISANSTNFTQHKTLSGIYTKVNNETHNGRDIFRNPNDFYILYDNANTRWTIVGPTSSNGVMWLSAKETLGDYGNIPTNGWSGLAFKRGFGGSAPGTNNSGWWNDTAVFSTQMFLYSAFMYEGTAGVSNTIIAQGQIPLSGWNPNFYWKDYDFSGIGYQNVTNPTFNERITLISPVHFIRTHHWTGNSTNIGEKINFLHKDGSISTRTILSSVFPTTLTNFYDFKMGILSSPVSAAAYPIGNIVYVMSNITDPTQFRNFLWGPKATGKVGVGAPKSRTIREYNTSTSFYPQITSVPKSLWVAENIFIRDSSTQYWYAEPQTKQLIFFGSTWGLGAWYPTPELFTTMNEYATALCQQFYGNPLMFQLTGYGF